MQSNIAIENHPLLHDFPTKASIYMGFPIATFDYRRVMGSERGHGSVATLLSIPKKWNSMQCFFVQINNSIMIAEAQNQFLPYLYTGDATQQICIYIYIICEVHWIQTTSRMVNYCQHLHGFAECGAFDVCFLNLFLID